MKSDALFLIYGLINDEFVLMARRLKDTEVTKKANEIQRKSKCSVLILEDEGQPEKRVRLRRSETRREKVVSKISNCRIIKKGDAR